MRSTRLEVDLDALAANLAALRGFLASTEKPPLLAAVIKADAYGLGAPRVARLFASGGADILAVAFLEEALEIRRGFGASSPLPILVMGHSPDEGLAPAVKAGIGLTIFDARQARLLSRAARTEGRQAVVHIKIDTGMNRLGIKPDASTPSLLAEIAALPGLALEGIFTHLALADAASDRAQFELFMGVVKQAEALGVHFRLRHVCDSIGLARYPEYRLDLVRAGAILYGARPSRAPLASGLELRVPFALRTRISRLRHIACGEGVGYDFTWRAPDGGADIATLPVGYVDGYRRCLSNRGEVIVRGARARVVGLICMDQLVVDVSGIAGVAEGDDVLLFGASGDAEIGLAELADWAGTNRNEILASVGRRVPRVYHRSGIIESVVDHLAREGQGGG